MRRPVGVLIGTVIGLGVVYGLARLNLALFPWPNFDWHNVQAWGDAIAVAPMTVQAMIVGAWAIGALVGGLIAVRIAEWEQAGWVVAALIVLASAIIALFVPQPLWMQLTTLAAPLVAGLVVSGAAGAA